MSNAFLYLTSAELTDTGRRRKNNEDSMVCLPQAGIFCVADGMGGTQGGEVASKAAVDALRHMFTAAPEASYAVTARASARLVARALNQASHWIKTRAEELGIAGTGSTAIVLAFDRVTPAQAVVLNAGDSRAYCFRGGKLRQLSSDHSVAAAAGLNDDKKLPAMFRGVITRAVGLENNVVMEETPVDVAAGDLFLLCSDGLTKMVDDKVISRLLKKNRSADAAGLARLLVDEALAAGGTDNVSVVVIHVAAELPSAPTMEVPVQTSEIEEAPVENPPAALAPMEGEQETAQTGQTIDTDGSEKNGVTPPEWAPKTPPTPPQLFSGEGRTPPSTTGRDIAESTARTETAPTAAAGSPAPRRKMVTWLWLVAVALVAAVVAVWFFGLKR